MQNEFLKLIEEATFYSFEPIIDHPVFKEWVKKETEHVVEKVINTLQLQECLIHILQMVQAQLKKLLKQ